MSAPSSKSSQQPQATTFNERLNEQLINCLNVQTNVIQNLAQYSQHISLQLFEIKSIVEILSNRVLALQQQQSHYPPSSYAASYYPNYMPQHTVPVPHQPPPPSHPPSVPFSVPPHTQQQQHHHHSQQLPVQTRLPNPNTAMPPNVNFPFVSSNATNSLLQQLQQPPPPSSSSSQTSSTPMPLFPFSTATSTQSSIANTLPPTTTTPTKTLFPATTKPTVTEPTTKPPAQTTTSSIFSTTSTTNSTNEKPATNNIFSFGTGNTAPTFGTGSLSTGFGSGGFLNTLSNISATKQEPNADENGDDDGEDSSYEPNVTFQPIVQLSAVEVKTGEEDENILFCERGKLYRFDSGKNEMKERGIGEMKILQHKSTNICRILMRREQVLKICANHQITSQIEIKPHSSAPNAFIWSAMDFADGEAKHETLCIRFKTEEQAKNFAKIFNEAKQNNVKTTNDASSTNNETKPKSTDNDDDVISIGEVKPSAEQIDRAKKLQLPSTFYLYENKDPCKGCPGCEEDTPSVATNENQTTTTTSKTESKASAPQTSSLAALIKTPLSSSENIKFSFTNPDKSQPQPQLQKQSSTKEEKTSTESPAPATPTHGETKSSIFGNFNGGSGTSIFGNATPLNNGTAVFGSGATLKPAAGATSGFSFPGFGNTSGSNTPSVGFQFSTPTTSTAPSTSNTSASGFSFGTTGDKPLFGNAAKFSFADLAKQTANDKPASNGTEQRVFAGQGSLVFGTSTLNSTTTTTGNNNDDDEGEGGGEDDSYEPNVSFKPIVQLSAVEVKTGEEDESVLFCERGKLYRFDPDTNQMKERGIGEMKILQHKTSNICRVLMRREQVLKLCANHKITSQMDLKPHSGTENAFVWSAMDFSEGETKHETFCIRFKSSDMANRFLKQFNDAKQINANAQQ